MSTTSQSLTTASNSFSSVILKIVIISCVAGLLFGYDSSVTNGSLIFMALPTQLNLSAFAEGLVTSSLLFGAIFGSLFAGPIADKYGRKKALILMAIISFIFRFGCVFAFTSSMMISFRFILGISIGGISVIVPMYLAEMATSKDRGNFIALYGLMIIVGQFLAFFVNALLGNLYAFMDDIWRYIFAISFLPATILLIGILNLPESPRWLIASNKLNIASLILQKIRPEQTAKKEFLTIKNLVDSEKHLTKASFKEILITPWIRRLLFIGMSIALTQQITGVNAINYYGTKILYDAGFNLNGALIANTANGIISIVATLVGMHYLNKVGRRKIFLTGLIMATITEFSIGIFTLTFSNQDYYAYIVFGLILVFMTFQQGCSSLVIWILMSELFPLRLRGIGLGSITLVSWFSNFLIGLYFPSLISAIGTAMTFFVFSLCGLTFSIIIFKYCPETKDHSLEELEYKFRHYQTIDCRK